MNEENQKRAMQYLGNARGMIERLSRFDVDEMAANPVRVQRLAAAALTELDAGRKLLALDPPPPHPAHER